MSGETTGQQPEIVDVGGNPDWYFLGGELEIAWWGVRRVLTRLRHPDSELPKEQRVLQEAYDALETMLHCYREGIAAGKAQTPAALPPEA